MPSSDVAKEVNMESQHPKTSNDVYTCMGKNYSVERYYMLSEIEQHALHPVYLDDYFASDNESETIEVETVATATSETEGHQRELPPFVILYLLWNCNSSSVRPNAGNTSVEEQAESFHTNHVEKALLKLQSLSETKENSKANVSNHQTKQRSVYLVVDALLWSDGEEDQAINDDNSNSNSNSNSRVRETRFREQLAVVEALAKKIALGSTTTTSEKEHKDDTCIRLMGATVGLADHARAAPGLEACLEAIMFGSKDRQRYGNQNKRTSNDIVKSNVGIVCNSLQDLVGYDEETETDAVQGVMQSLSHVVLANKSTVESSNSSINNRRSPILEYADKAHRDWRVETAGLSPEPTLEEIRANEKYDVGDKDNFWILALLVLFLACWWQSE